MDRLERFYRIQKLLRSRKLVSTQDFVDDLEVSRATFKRDLEYLRDRFQAPIVFDRELRGYRLEDDASNSGMWQLPGLWFSADELQALLSMDRLLREMQPGVLSGLLRPIRNRLKELLEAGEHSAEDIARRIRVLPMGARRVEPAHFRALAAALLAQRRIRIQHYRRYKNDTLERKVSPQRLVHYRDNWYLDAWCHKRRALRTFAVDAIKYVRLTEEIAQQVSERRLDRHFASGYGIFAGSDTKQAVLQFNAERARWVSGEIWHPEQDGKLQLDGSYLLQFPYSREPELVMDILRYGSGVEVLAPESLRNSVARELRSAVSKYSESTA